MTTSAPPSEPWSPTGLRRCRLVGACLAVAMVTACSGASKLSGAAPTSQVNRTPTTATRSGDPTEAALPAGLSTGAARLTVSGAYTASAELTEVSSTFGAPGEAGLGPGYQFQNDEQRLILRLPPGPVGKVFTPGSLRQPVQIDLEHRSAGGFYTTGSAANPACTVTVTEMSGHALRGNLTCAGLHTESKDKSVDITGSFELSA